LTSLGKRPRGKRIEERAAEKRAQRAESRAKGLSRARGGRTAPSPVFSAAKPDGPLAVWVQVVHSLEQSGFGAAGPEYLRLSQAVREAHAALQSATGARKGRTREDDGWEAVRTVTQRALELLRPIVDAATLLHELPRPQAEPTRTRARARSRPKTKPTRQPVAGVDPV
jgi:hypothetical protein